MNTEAETLANALNASRTGPGKWQARCPYHDDKKPSLSVKEGPGGKTLVHCHAGCEDVFERLIADGHIPRRAELIKAAKPDATYPYVSADGELLFEVVRFPGKAFRPRRPDGQGGWFWGAPKEIRVPYRLPDVIGAATDKLIFIVEGEKDADKLAAQGYVATTNPFGAGKWREQYNEYFVGHRVVIVPDNDEPGRDHAERVRAQLEPVAASVQVLSLENEVAAKGDVSDLIDEQGIEHFERLVDQLPPRRCGSRAYHTITDLDRLPPVRWLADGLIAERSSVLLYGDSGVGKSFVAVDLCVRVATGQPVHGRETRQGTAIYVALEGQAGLRDRLYAAAMQVGCQDPKNLPLAVIYRSVDLLSGESVSGLIAAIGEATKDFGSSALIVIDTLSRAIPGADENGSKDMNRVNGALTRIQEETGATVLTVHHSGKTVERGARGHSSLRAAVDTELLVAQVKGDKYLKVTKQRDGEDQIKLRFELAKAQVPAADDQGMAETLVVRPGGQCPTETATKVSPKAEKFWKALEAALAASSRRASDEEAEQLGCSAGTPVATKHDWLEQARGMQLSKSDGGLRKALNRAIRDLTDAEILRQAGDCYWMSQPAGLLGRPGHRPGHRPGQARTGRT